MRRNEALAPLPAAEALWAGEGARQAGGPESSPAELWQLMERQAALYTNMDSGSVPAETAEELLRSVLFCIQTALDEHPDTARLPLAERLLFGQRVLAARHHQGQRLQRRAEGLCLPLDNAVYREVLGECRQFFTWYDIRFLAHQIPCMIDYPLAIPVADELLGVDYINAWLQRRSFEDGFCRLFPIGAVRACLARFAPDYTELPLNLFEPVFNCALGQAAVDAGAIGLAPGPGQHAALKRLFAGRSTAQAGALLEQAVGRLCNRLHIWDSPRRRYLAACAAALAPHIRAASDAGLANLFVNPDKI